MEPVRFPISRWKIALHLLGCLVFIAIAIFGTRAGMSPIIWIAFYFLLPASSLVQRLFSNAPAIEISDTGISDRTPLLGVGEILWEDIELIYLGGGIQKGLCVTVSDPQPYLARLDLLRRLNARLNSLFGLTPILLLLGTTAASPDDIWNAVQSRFERFGGTTTSS